MLSEYLRAQSEEEADRLLGELQNLIHPILIKAFRADFRVSMRGADGKAINQDAMELAADAEVSLVHKLRQIRDNGGEIPIDNLEGYVRTVTRNAYREYVRRRHPVRTSLKNQIRYVLGKMPGLALHRDQEHGWICGLSEFDPGTPGRPAKIPTEQDVSRLRSDPRCTRLPGLVRAMLSVYGAPVPLERLVSDIYEFKRLREPIEIEAESLTASTPAAGPPHGSHVEHRELLEKLWGEIRRLPLLHRRALLLNLTNREGESLIAELPMLRIASITNIADALEMSAVELAEIWSSLPLPDEAIAKRLGLTRQQVANLRHSARVTLKRRMGRGSENK